MVERMLGESVRGATEEAARLVEHPMRPPAEQAAPLQENVAAAQAAAIAVVESGQRARELSAPTRNEQRKAEDRGLIIEVAGQAGVTLSEERAEEIRGEAWRAADRAAKSDDARNAAVEAGQAEAESGGAQEVRDAMGRVLGDAAEEAAYQIIRRELQGEGLSGEALDAAARQMAERAGSREIRDAGAWTREQAGDILAEREREPQPPPPVRGVAVGEAGAAAGTAAAPVAVATEEVPAEREVSFSAVRLGFGYNIDTGLLTQALAAMGRLDDAKYVLYLGERDLTRANVLSSMGLDLTGANSFVFDTDKMIGDGLVRQEELKAFMDARPSSAQVFAFLYGKIMEGASVENASERLDAYASIEGHENMSAFAALQAIDYISSIQRELGSVARIPAEADEATKQELSAQKDAISGNIAARVDALHERVDEWNSVLDQLRGRPDDMATTVVTPSGVERNGSAGELRSEYQERLERDQNELARLETLSRSPELLANLVRRTGWRGEPI